MLSAIRDKKLNLKSTQTKVLTVDGRLLTEGRDEAGRVVVKEIEKGKQGYIGDVKEDLQVGEVLAGLIIGSQDVAHKWELLEKHRVTHILNAASLVENIFVDKITYRNIKIYDIPEADIRKHFHEAHEFIEEGRELGCVLVHCNAGVSRAATLVISYLMKVNKMTFDEAHDYLREKRPVIRPNDGFRYQLKEYDLFLRKNNYLVD